MPYEKIPLMIMDGLKRYEERRTPTGSFLRAVLENNLMAAVQRADEDSLAALRDICSYVHWEMRGDCHGSPLKVHEWLNPVIPGTLRLTRINPDPDELQEARDARAELITPYLQAKGRI